MAFSASMSLKSITDTVPLAKKAAVGSTGERNGPRQCSSWGAVSEGLARSAVKLQRDQVEVVLTVHRKVALPGQVLPRKSLLVFSEVARCQGRLGSQK